MTKPKLSDKIKKKENINFPVTVKQKKELMERADKANVTVAEYLRQVLFPVKREGKI